MWVYLQCYYLLQYEIFVVFKNHQPKEFISLQVSLMFALGLLWSPHRIQPDFQIKKKSRV